MCVPTYTWAGMCEYPGSMNRVYGCSGGVSGVFVYRGMWTFPWHTPEMVTEVGFMHPSGMHSCIANFCQKLHENEILLTEREVSVPGAPWIQFVN